MTCLHLATIGGTCTEHNEWLLPLQGKAFITRTNTREIYIYFSSSSRGRAPLPFYLMRCPTSPLLPLPPFPLLPFCCVSTPTICVEQNVWPVASDKLSLATPAWTHLAPYPFYCCCLFSLPLPLALLLPLLSRQTTCRTANALFVFQHDASSSAAAEAATVRQRLQSRQLRARLVEEAASYYIHGKWHKLHVNCDAATWPAPA